MFGLVVRFDLNPGAGQNFDALVAETLPKIQVDEPGTLIYTCHWVEEEPNARIFYELYRNRAAFEEHERQSHIRRFLEEREQHLARPPRFEFLAFHLGKGAPSTEG